MTKDMKDIALSHCNRQGAYIVAYHYAMMDNKYQCFKYANQLLQHATSPCSYLVNTLTNPLPSLVQSVATKTTQPFSMRVSLSRTVTKPTVVSE